MRAWKAQVEIEPWPEGGYKASVPSLQGCWVVADTREEAIRDIHEVIEMSIASRIKRGEAIPPDVQEIQGPGASRIQVELAVVVP